MLKRRYILLCCLVLVCTTILGQPSSFNTLDSIAGRFIKDLRKHPTEKILMHTDRWFYDAGETIWFKAYSLNAYSNRPVHLSKNLFVDLVNDKDSVISQVLLNIQDNKTSGRMPIPRDLKEGYYWLRAYTIKILREDSSRMLVKPLFVVNLSKPDTKIFTANRDKSMAEPLDTGAPQLVFYPEGGSIISGTQATVAFRASSPLGKPLELSGYVSDSRDSITVKFSTSLPGMGKFSFDAWNPRKYTVHIKWKNNRDLSFPLPRINQFASQLSVVNQTPQAFHVRVSLGDSLYKKNKTTYLLGISRDSLCFGASGTDMYEVDIPKNSFPKGKATLLLFNEQKQIVSERFIYIDSSINLVANSDKKSYGPREKVKLDLSALTLDGHPALALLSLSVIDSRWPQPVEGQDKLDGFADEDLGSVQTGSNLDPGRENQFTGEQIDLMMMTQKYIHPDWLYHVDTSQEPPAIHSPADPDSNVVVIRGRIVNKINEPVLGCIVNLFSQQNNLFRVDTTDQNGNFHFKVGDFDDGTSFGLKLTTMQGSSRDGRVVMDNSGFPQFPTPAGLKKMFDPADLELIRHYQSRQSDTSVHDFAGQTLNPVTVEPDQGGPPSGSLANRASRFSYIIPGDKLQNGDPNALPNAIKQVPGFNRGLTMGPGGTPTGEAPLVVVDGVTQNLPADDVNSFLMSLDPGLIDYIEILKGSQTAIYGMQGAGGVILIYTLTSKRGVAVISDKGLATIMPKGYCKQSNFPFPDYSIKQDPKAPATEDLRTTIYWNGNILTDSKGNASMDFYTADPKAGSYSVWILGVTSTGTLLNKRIKIIRP
jgi:hypothetical protein